LRLIGSRLFRFAALSDIEHRFGRDWTQGEEIMTPPPEPTDLELIRRIAAAGGTKYTAGNIDRGKYQRLVSLG